MSERNRLFDRFYPLSHYPKKQRGVKPRWGDICTPVLPSRPGRLLVLLTGQEAPGNLPRRPAKPCPRNEEEEAESLLLLVASALCLIRRADFDEARRGNSRLNDAARFTTCLFSKTTWSAFRECDEKIE